MPIQRDRGGSANPRIPLKSAGVLYAIYARGAPKPIIAIERGPESGLKIVAEMSLERANGALRLSVGTGRELIV